MRLVFDVQNIIQDIRSGAHWLQRSRFIMGSCFRKSTHYRRKSPHIKARYRVFCVFKLGCRSGWIKSRAFIILSILNDLPPNVYCPNDIHAFHRMNHRYSEGLPLEKVGLHVSSYRRDEMRDLLQDWSWHESAQSIIWSFSIGLWITTNYHIGKGIW